MNARHTFDLFALAAAVSAGVGFGAFFVALDRSGDKSGLWPLVFGKIGGAVFLSTILAASKPLRDKAFAFPIRPVLGLAALSGLLDVAANGFYLTAVRKGLLSIVAVISSLYPASTVVLANRILKERISRLQLGGMVLATCAIALVAAG